MTAFPKVDMFEVTRLTREGRLAEAMALLRGRPAAADANRRGGADGPDGKPDGSVLDMTAPAAPGDAWTFADGPPASGPPGAKPETRTRRDLLAGLGDLRDRARKKLGRRAPVSVPDGARFEERTFASAAGRRTAKVYVPARHAGPGLPVVVMLHGCTQGPDDFAIGTRMNEVAEDMGFLVVWPRQPPSANLQKCWNWFKASEQRRGEGEPSLIAGLALQVVEEFAADAGRVYVAGLSAGGAAAAVMGATYPDVFAAVGVHSGLACGAASDLKSALSAMSGRAAARARRGQKAIPAIVFHGDADRVVNPVNADGVAGQASAGAAVRSEVTAGVTAGLPWRRRVGFDGEGRAILEQWTVHGAGHAWSGGNPAGSFTEPRGPDASREMARFFLSHRR